MKIAILACRKADNVCTGAGCFRAFSEKKGAFSRYKNQNAEIAAFMHCNGCSSDPETDKGILEKVERLKKEQIKVLHLGVCTKKNTNVRCRTIEKIVDQLKDSGIAIVDGTHE
ncbi:MAG: CGGC domain-containing protein [Marvinbryantia sp.]|jgi:predicted metal-binding protein